MSCICSTSCLYIPPCPRRLFYSVDKPSIATGMSFSCQDDNDPGRKVRAQALGTLHSLVTLVRNGSVLLVCLAIVWVSEPPLPNLHSLSHPTGGDMSTIPIRKTFRGKGWGFTMLTAIPKFLASLLVYRLTCGPFKAELRVR